MKLYYKSILLICAAIIAAVGTGCTHLYKVEPKMTAVHADTKIQASVALVLDKALEDFHYEYNDMGDTFIFPYGPALKDYARNVTIAVFENVSIVSSPAELSGKSADLILHLKGVKAEQKHTALNSRMSQWIIVVEWTARDRTNTKDIWIKTIRACFQNGFLSQSSIAAI